MRTSYFRDIAESMARNAQLERMANGSYARPRNYGNTYYSDMARYFQDSGSPSMEVARRPSQQEFFEIIYNTLPPAWRDMSPQDAWNAFQQLPIPNQNTFAKEAGIQWTDVPTIGMGTEGGDRRPGAVSEPQMIRETRSPVEMYDTLFKSRLLPQNPDGTPVTKEQWYNMGAESQGRWVNDVALPAFEERRRRFEAGDPNVVFQSDAPTISGFDVERQIPPQPGKGSSQINPSSEKSKPADGKKGKGKARRPGGNIGSSKRIEGNVKRIDVAPTSGQDSREEYRGIPTQQLYKKNPPKRVLGGPNTILDFFGDARSNQYRMPKAQSGQLIYMEDLDKAGLGNFFKGVGRTLHDYGRGWADSLGNLTGLYDLSNEKYKTKFGKKFSGKADKLMRGVGSIGRMAADIFIPGAGTGLSMLGSALNPQGLGAKQQQRDMARKQMALGASGMAGPNWASNMGNAMNQNSPYNPSGFENTVASMVPGLEQLLPSLLGPPQSPGGPSGQGQGVFRQGGIPVSLARHMQFMSMFEQPQDYSRGTGTYLVY